MNDHKNLMKSIEKGLHELHGQQREGIGLPADVPSASIQHAEPIARVNFVAENSPAEEAVSIYIINFTKCYCLITLIIQTKNYNVNWELKPRLRAILIFIDPRPSSLLSLF